MINPENFAAAVVSSASSTATVDEKFKLYVEALEKANAYIKEHPAEITSLDIRL